MTLSDALQLLVAVVVAYVAIKAWQTSNRQAKSAQDALAETRIDRHVAALPILSIEPNIILPMAMAAEMRVRNQSTNPAVQVRVSVGEAADLGFPATIFLHIVPTVPMIGPGDEHVLPVEFGRFARYELGEQPNRLLRTNWVHVRLVFSGILGASIQEDWYWEPFEWLGQGREPYQGHGEKLVLFSVTGSTGAEQANDISFVRT